MTTIDHHSTIYTANIVYRIDRQFFPNDFSAKPTKVFYLVSKQIVIQINLFFFFLLMLDNKNEFVVIENAEFDHAKRKI